MITDQQVFSDAVRQALDDLTADYARRAAQAGFDPDGYFAQLRRLIEARAVTQTRVADMGAMGGGGANEA